MDIEEAMQLDETEEAMQLDKTVQAHTVKATSDLAFNLARDAYNYDMPGRVLRQTLSLRKLVKLNKSEKTNKLNQATCPTLQPTDEEVGGRTNKITGL